jgi:hypothetical protein
MNGKESLPKKPRLKVITKFRTNAATAQKYLELGERKEQERIIKLLEGSACWNPSAKVIIQQIKGEENDKT